MGSKLGLLAQAIISIKFWIDIVLLRLVLEIRHSDRIRKEVTGESDHRERAENHHLNAETFPKCPCMPNLVHSN
jgi:hypothetical protein